MVICVATVVVAACAPPTLAPPQPATLHTAKSPMEAVQASTRELISSGYDVAVSDANAGTVAASRKASPETFGADLSCRWPKGSMASTMGETALRLNVSARPAAAGSDVVISAHATTTYAKLVGMFKDIPDSETDCVSSGAVEKRLTDVLGK